MKDGDIISINQLVDTIEKSSLKLEEFYEKKDYEEFNKSKKLILSLLNKISKTMG